MYTSYFQLERAGRDSRQHISTYNSVDLFLFSQHLPENLKEIANLKTLTDIIS